MAIDIEMEFSSEHRKVLNDLLEIESACDRLDAAKIRTLAGELDVLLGPHFYFEEHDLYPAAQRFLGEERVNKLIEDHGPVAPALKELKNLTDLTREKAEAIKKGLRAFYIHVSDCEGITILIAAMRDKDRQELAERLEKCLGEIGTLTALKGVV